MQFYEALSGGRMHSAILRSGGIIHSLPLYLMKEVILIITQNAVKLQEIHNLVTRNRIFITRLAYVAIISKKISEVYGLSGVLIRATDFKKDLRVTGYEYYGNLEFNVVNSSKGDSLDRQLVRMNESLESLKTISECIKRLGRWKRRSSSIQNLVITKMESMIHYFKLLSEGQYFAGGETYLRQEAPKGELASQVLSGIINPSRVKIRSPDYQNLQALNIISTEHQLADLIATLGTADFVLGSVDRKARKSKESGNTSIRNPLKTRAEYCQAYSKVMLASLLNALLIITNTLNGDYLYDYSHYSLILLLFFSKGISHSRIPKRNLMPINLERQNQKGSYTLFRRLLKKEKEILEVVLNQR